MSERYYVTLSFVDQETGTRLALEREFGDQIKATVYPPENGDSEDIYAAIKRLLEFAKQVEDMWP